jgi:hypothetical protein
VNTRPQVGALGDGALAVWVNNPSNQIIGDVAHPDTIQFARYTLSTNAWTTATTVISELTGRPTTSVNRWTSKRVLPQFGLFAGGWMGICQGFPAQIVRVS